MELTKGIDHLTLKDLSEMEKLDGVSVLEARPIIRAFMEKHKIGFNEARNAYRIYLLLVE